MPVLHLLNEAAVAFHKIPSGFWQALLASGVLTPLVNVVKHVHLTRKEQELGHRAIFVLVALGSFLLAFAQYMLAVHPGDPYVILVHTAVVGFISTPVYLFALKPLWDLLASRGNKEVKTATLPAEGLPVNTAQQNFEKSVTIQDFKS